MRVIPYTKTETVHINDTMTEIVEETRFKIVDDYGNLIDDAQGRGFKTAQKAYREYWYKFQGGRAKMQNPAYIESREQKHLKKLYDAGSKWVELDENGKYVFVY